MKPLADRFPGLHGRPLARPQLPTALAVLAGGTMIASQMVELSTTRVLTNDFVSYVLPASSFQSGLGAPYKNYWDIKPPLLLAHLAVWMAVFGSSLVSFYWLEALWLAVLLGCGWIALRRMAPPWVALAALVSATIVMPATASLGMFFPSEVPGLALVLLGVVLLSGDQSQPWQFLLAGFLLTSAGQFKDVYVFAPLVLVPAVVGSSHRLRMTMYGLVGAVLAFVATLAYLLANDSLGAYRQVLEYKHSVFPYPGTLLLLSNVLQLVSGNGTGLVIGLSGALLLFVVVMAIVRPASAVATPTDTHLGEDRPAWICEPALLILLLWCLLAVGFAWQGKPAAYHYVVTLQLPTVLAVVAAFRILAKHRRSRPARLGVWLLALICLAPQPSLFRSYLDQAQVATPARVIRALQGLERPQDIAAYVRPGQLSPSGRCIQVAYGWAAANVYHYSHRPSCSRYFLSALITKPSQAAELRRQIAMGGPAVIVYETDAADLDVASFEKTAFPWKAVVTGCYVDQGGGIFTAKSPDRLVVAACIAAVMVASGLPPPTG